MISVSAFRFIQPCSPIRAKEVPAGEGWLHEVKFDGYRVQVHKVGSRVVIYSRNGHDFTERFPSVAQLLHELPAKAGVLDGEVVASDADGRPNFARLHVRWARPGAIQLWAFNLLAFNGRDLRPQPLYLAISILVCICRTWLRYFPTIYHLAVLPTAHSAKEPSLLGSQWAAAATKTPSLS